MTKFTKILVIFVTLVILSQSFKVFYSKNVQTTTKSEIVVNAQKCNATHFQFYGLNYFLLERQMILGFQIMNQEYSDLQQLPYGADDSNSYYIYRPKAIYTYKNPNVSAKFVSQKQIRISGGYVEVNIEFDWTHYGPYSTQQRGKGTAFAVSKQMPYVVNNTAQYFFGITNVTFPKFDQIKLTSLDTEDQQKDPITDEERFIFNYMLNINPSQSLKSVLQKQLFNIELSLHRVHYQAFPSTKYEDQYVWCNTLKKNNAFVAELRKDYKLLKTDSTSSNPGVYLSYFNNIQNFAHQVCGKSVVQVPSNPTTYGTSQQIISFTYLQNMLKFAMQKNKLNSTLNRQNWGTKSFNFTAREMSFIFSNITQNFSPTAEVQGQCLPDAKTLKLIKASNSTFNVSITQKCNLHIKETKLVEFSLNLTIEIQGAGKQTYLDFWASSFSSTTVYNDTFGFKMQNKVLADMNIRETLNRLYETNLFGSGLKLGMKRSVPLMAVLDAAILIYDAKK